MSGYTQIGLGILFIVIAAGILAVSQVLLYKWLQDFKSGINEK